MRSHRMRVLVYTLRFIAVVQFILGIGFLLAPVPMSEVLGLPKAAGWANWLFGMMAARFLGFGYGMLVAARDPYTHVSWIKAMIFIQVVDWFCTIYYVMQDEVTWLQVNTASFFPVIFVLLLWATFPRKSDRAHVRSETA